MKQMYHSDMHINSTPSSQRLKVATTNKGASSCSSETVTASLMGKSLTLLQPSIESFDFTYEGIINKELPTRVLE
jgi:hypothetical protein